MGLIPDSLMPSPEEAKRIIEELLNTPVDLGSSTSVVGSSYKDVVFESVAYHESGRADKVLLSFDGSLARLRKAGFERHARSQEVFGLLIDGLEGKLADGLKGVHNDMLGGYGEWLSLAVERKGDMLVAYLDPKKLAWDKNCGEYIVQGNQVDCVGKETFGIKGKQSQTWIDLREFEDKFVKFVYGCSFSQLPKLMQEGDERAQVYLPLEGVVRPVCRGYFGRFSVNSYGYNYLASRGVRRR